MNDAQRQQQPDNVNHPPHYKAHPSGVECIDVVEHMGYNIGNAVKYLWRNGLKDGIDDLEDLRKARWYIDREISKREKERALKRAHVDTAAHAHSTSAREPHMFIAGASGLCDYYDTVLGGPALCNEPPRSPAHIAVFDALAR